MIAGGKTAEDYFIGVLFLLAAIILLCLRFFPKFEEKRSSEEENVIDLQLWYPWENEGEAYKKSFLEAVEAYNSAMMRYRFGQKEQRWSCTGKKLPSAIASNDTPDYLFLFWRQLSAGGSEFRQTAEDE